MKREHGAGWQSDKSVNWYGSWQVVSVMLLVRPTPKKVNVLFSYPLHRWPTSKQSILPIPLIHSTSSTRLRPMIFFVIEAFGADQPDFQRLL
ncbi:hypothetical protein ACVJBD_007376 [Rhizobium mongolense]